MSQVQEYARPDNQLTDSRTKTKILKIAIRLFAQRGFKGTSLKDIANELDIQVASLYKHYDSKEALIEAVLKVSEKNHKAYNTWLHTQMEKASTVEEVMDALFNESFLTGMNSTARLCMSIAMKEQHNSKSVYRYLLKTLYSEAIQSMEDGFNRLVMRGIVPPSDTHTLATIFMFCTMALNDVHIHEGADTVTPFDRSKIYDGLRAMMTNAIAQGVIPEE